MDPQQPANFSEICKLCKRKNRNMLFLPCRHASCIDCFILWSNAAPLMNRTNSEYYAAITSEERKMFCPFEDCGRYPSPSGGRTLNDFFRCLARGKETRSTFLSSAKTEIVCESGIESIEQSKVDSSDKKDVKVLPVLASPAPDHTKIKSIPVTAREELSVSSGLVIQLNKRGSKKRKSKEDIWWTHFTLLLQYKDRTGNYDVPRLYEEQSDDDGELRSLGVWLEQQRHLYFMGQMNGDEFFAIDQIVKAGEMWATSSTMSTLSTCDDSVIPASSEMFCSIEEVQAKPAEPPTISLSELELRPVSSPLVPVRERVAALGSPVSFSSLLQQQYSPQLLERPHFSQRRSVSNVLDIFAGKMVGYLYVRDSATFFAVGKVRAVRVKRTRSRDPLAKGAFTVVDLLAYRPWAVDDVDSAVCSGSFAEQVLSSYFKPLDCEEVVSVRIEDIVVTDVQLDNNKLMLNSAIRIRSFIKEWFGQHEQSSLNFERIA